MQCTVRPRHGVSRGLFHCAVCRYKLGLWCKTVLKSWVCFGSTRRPGWWHLGAWQCYQCHTLSVPQQPCAGVLGSAGGAQGPCCRQGDKDRSVAFPQPEGRCPQHIPSGTSGGKSGYKYPLCVLSLDI